MHRFLQGTVDALTTCIAVLDEQGEILVVNKAWRSFGETHLASPLSFSVGDNYLAACVGFGRGPGKSPPLSVHMSSIAAGIGEVIDQQRESFDLEYSWLAGESERWFNLCVTRFDEERAATGESARLVVAQEDITTRKQAENALREREALLRLATEAGEVGLWEWDLATNRQNWNAELKIIFGLPPEATGLTTETLIAAIHPEDVVETERIFRTALEQGLEYEHTYRIVRPDGSERWITARGRGYYDEMGNPLHMCGFAVDVTEDRQTEEALRESEERFRNSFRSAAIGKALVALDGRWLQVNQALCDLLGYDETQLLQLTFQDITHSDDLETDMGLVKQLVEGTLDSYQLEKRYLHSRGSEIWALLSVSVVRDRGGAPLYFVSEVVDITPQKQDLQLLQKANAHLHDLAHDDALTGLKNRRSFDERLKQEIATTRRGASPFSVLLLDIDHFKLLNDSYGHMVGDEVLQALGRILCHVMRPGDFIARYGGEEFALILPSTGVTGSVRAAERARRAIADFPWPSRPVTASFGVATWHDEDAQTLLAKADLALYAAKAAGRDRVRHQSIPEAVEEAARSTV